MDNSIVMDTKSIFTKGRMKHEKIKDRQKTNRQKIKMLKSFKSNCKEQDRKVKNGRYEQKVERNVKRPSPNG